MPKKANKKAVAASRANSAASVSTGAARSARKQGQQGMVSNDMVSAPAAMGLLVGPRRPQVTAGGGGDARILVSHREYFGPVGPSTAGFDVTKHYVNPGLPAMFPWLAGMARLYESYIFRKLQIEYVPSVGTATAGSVSMALDYDAFDTAPVDKATLLANHSSVRGPAWSPLVLKADTSDLRKFGVQRYTRQDTLADNLDIKTYDVAGLFIATDASAAHGVTWGDLFISYTVELITPQAPNWDFWDPTHACAKVASGGNYTVDTPLGSAPVKTGGLQLQVIPDGSGVTVEKPGQYLLDFTTLGGLMNDPVPTLAVQLGTAVLTTIANSTLQDLGAGAFRANAKVLADISNVPCTITETFFNKAGGITSQTLRVAPWDYSIL